MSMVRKLVGTQPVTQTGPGDQVARPTRIGLELLAQNVL
jgi:hypothetical protein